MNRLFRTRRKPDVAAIDRLQASAFLAMAGALQGFGRTVPEEDRAALAELALQMAILTRYRNTGVPGDGGLLKFPGGEAKTIKLVEELIEAIRTRSAAREAREDLVASGLAWDHERSGMVG